MGEKNACEHLLHAKSHKLHEIIIYALFERSAYYELSPNNVIGYFCIIWPLPCYYL